jgi:hypothetical protein
VPSALKSGGGAPQVIASVIAWALFAFQRMILWENSLHAGTVRLVPGGGFAAISVSGGRAGDGARTVLTGASGSLERNAPLHGQPSSPRRREPAFQSTDETAKALEYWVARSSRAMKAWAGVSALDSRNVII